MYFWRSTFYTINLIYQYSTTEININSKKWLKRRIKCFESYHQLKPQSLIFLQKSFYTKISIMEPNMLQKVMNWGQYLDHCTMVPFFGRGKDKQPVFHRMSKMHSVCKKYKLKRFFDYYLFSLTLNFNSWWEENLWVYKHHCVLFYCTMLILIPHALDNPK